LQVIWIFRPGLINGPFSIESGDGGFGAKVGWRVDLLKRLYDLAGRAAERTGDEGWLVGADGEIGFLDDTGVPSRVAREFSSQANAGVA
jgi:hypothetical protein